MPRSPLLLSLVAALGVVLILAETVALPRCADPSGTGAPCRVERSVRASEYLLTGDLRVVVPVPLALGGFLVLTGLAGVSALRLARG